MLLRLEIKINNGKVEKILKFASKLYDLREKSINLKQLKDVVILNCWKTRHLSIRKEKYGKNR